MGRKKCGWMCWGIGKGKNPFLFPYESFPVHLSVSGAEQERKSTKQQQ
jgi:hypothetical protein